MSKLVSVIIPVYNVEKYLKRCLDSVLAQTYENLEVICVNDGSADQSLSILNDYALKDTRVKVFDKKNGGAASARNYALKNATGDYIAFVDPDDWIESSMYETIIEKMERLSADIGCCGFYKNWDNKETEMKNDEEPGDELFNGEIFLIYAMKRFVFKSVGGYLWNKVFSRDVIKNLMFEESLLVGEDVMFFAKSAMNSSKNVYCNQPLYHYYQRTDSLCHNSNVNARKGSLNTYETLIQMFEKEGYSEELIALTKRFYTYHASLLTEKAYMSHDKEVMREMQKNIEKYIDAYYKTSGEHHEWNKKMQLMMTDPEKAITYSRNLKDAERRNAYASALSAPIKENHILYESFFGRGMVCGPYAMFLSIKKSNLFNDFTHVWSISNKDELVRLQKEYSEYSNVVFILRSSNEYAQYLATCKYLINNDNFFYFFVKRDEQIYLNTWHGIPMKKLGYDVPDGIIEQHNSFRNFRMTDYLLGWNEHMQKTLADAYSLNTNYSGEILLSGCPRNDITLSANREEVLNKLRGFGVSVNSNKKIVLFAPTFRGANLQTATADIDEVLEFLNRLEAGDEKNEYSFLFKPHHLVYQAILNEKVNDPRIIPAFMDANEIMSVSDIMISDYSSIYLDYLVTDRPIVFYVPDEDEYKEYRGLYYDTSKLPGKVCRNIDEVVDFFKDISVNEDYKPVYREYKEWACSLDDGHVCDRLWDKLFNYKGRNEIEKSHDKKEVLILCGSLYDDENFERLMDNIEKYKEDSIITVLFDQPKTEILKKKIIDNLKGVRGLSRVTAMPITYTEGRLCEGIICVEKGTEYPYAKIHNLEKKRCLYDMTFDLIIKLHKSEFEGNMINLLL